MFQILSMPKVLATKIVSWLRFSWSCHQFYRETENKLFKTLNAGLNQASYLQDSGHSARKDYMLNKCSKNDFISITLLAFLWHGYSR